MNRVETGMAQRVDKPKKGRFKTRIRHRTPLSLLPATRRPGDRQQPTMVELPAERDTRDPRPPVRIFVGTEPAQFRAERVFVWSVRKHRDPGRTYQIYLMSELAGFDRTGWKTGFTNYRYAIPGLTGYTGRAIYNDVDQIYLSDPAELFELDMGDRAVLSIDERETSVMLLDCARLMSIWNIEEARVPNKHKWFRRRVHEAGLWGTMDPGWNTRDGEYVPGSSRLLHFTTLHTQPWQPFPRELRYEPHPLASIWMALEREADQNGFTVFSESVPSTRYRELVSMYETMHADGRPDTGHAASTTFAGISLARHVSAIGGLARTFGARTILDYGSGKGALYESAAGHPPESRFKTMPAWGEAVITCYDPGYEPFAAPFADTYDGVISTDVLEHIPAEDVPWVLRLLFAHARKFLYVVAACYPAKKILPDGTNAHCTIRPYHWWVSQVELAARGFPDVEWVLCTQEKSAFAFDQRKRLTKRGIRRRVFSRSGSLPGR